MARRSLPILALLLVVTAALRLHDLDARTLTHPESYIPRLDFRAPFDSPSPRRTLWETVQRTIDDDNHPPAQLVFMYAWTGVFGTGLFAIRLPSVIFGVLGVLFTWLLARRVEGERTAHLAATLLALNGLHLFWSQHARIWVLVAAIAVLAVWLAIELERAPTRAKALAFVAVSALGLWTEYYYWIFFAAQVAWAALQPPSSSAPHSGSAIAPERESPGPPPMLRLQAAALVLTTPMAVFLWSHATLRKHFVVPKTLPRLTEVLAGNGLANQGLAERWLGDAASGALVAAALGGAALYLRAAWFPPRALGDDAARSPYPPLRGLVVLSAVASTAILVAFRAFELAKPAWVAPALALPAIGALAWLLIGRLWPKELVRRAGASRLGARLARDPILAQCAGTLLLLVVVSAAKPMLVARGLLILSPLCAILLARAALSLPGLARPVVATTLVVLAAFSAHHAKTEPNAPADFQALGRALSAELAPGATVAVQNGWWAQPVVYYLDQDRNPVTTPELLEERAQARSAPDAFWLVVYGVDDEALEANQREVLERFGQLGYAEAGRVEAFGGSALHFRAR